jgi:hypothetical protein
MQANPSMTKYTMAIKRAPASQPPADWPERLARIEGVIVEGHTDRGAQFTATPEALAKVRAAFSEQFHIEEVIERKPM